MEDEVLICRNCAEELDSNDSYCPHCGQKTDAHILSVKELLSNFWNSLFNFDNTIFSTLKNIWRPWKLTQYYVDGKRKAFLNPMRLFIITLLLQFAILVSLTTVDNKMTRSIDEFNKLERSKMYEKFIGLRNEHNLEKDACIFADTIEQKIFMNTAVPELDTFSISGLFNFDEYSITRKDAIELKSDSLFSKYKITSFKDKLIIEQMIHMNLDRAGMIKHGIHNAAWGVFLAVFLLAGLMKLLYVRHRIKYIVHLVSLLNLHSFCFIVTSLCLIIFNLGVNNSTVEDFMNAFVLIFLPVSLFLNLYYTYNQKFFKTFIKFLIISTLYITLGITLVLAVGVMSLIFF